MKVGFVSLGCSKNLVDTEMTIGIFKQYKYEIVNNVEDSEIIVINTCGFIESAKQEAINSTLVYNSILFVSYDHLNFVIS